MSNGIEILVYITAEEHRVLGGDPLTLLIKDINEQKEISKDLGRALRANVMQLKNGDYVLVSEA
jgi:hypothetical protein